MPRKLTIMNIKLNQKLLSPPAIPKKQLDLHTPPESVNPLASKTYVKFEDTFFVKFLENQLENYSRHPNHHKYDEVMKRYWLLGRYFSGKQFFKQLSGKKNQNIPCNWRTNLQYNIIIPSNNTMKNWTPKGSIGFCEYSKFVFESLLPDSCKKVCITVDGMKVLKKLEWIILMTSYTLH